MAWIAAAIAVVITAIVFATYKTSRPRTRRSPADRMASPVTQQHLHLMQGGRLCESEIESAKSKAIALLDRGDFEHAVQLLRPGLQFAVNVQAIAESGHPGAAAVLERGLLSRLSDDSVEQSWYWIDLAHGLRELDRPESMPALLRCAANSPDVPLGEFYAAETACAAGFFESLRHPAEPLGRAALTVLHRTLRGVRYGVPPQVIGTGRLGQAVVRVWKNRPEGVEPRVVRVLVEALRLLRRVEHYKQGFRGHAYHVEALHRQFVELANLEDTIADYLSDAPWMLVHDLGRASDGSRLDLLRALDDLRADPTLPVISQSARWPAEQREFGIALLRHSRELEVSTWLVEQSDRRTDGAIGLRAATLRALSGHSGEASEAILLRCAGDREPAIRRAAVGSLGWWEPVRRTETLSCLRECRHDASPDVRLAAQCALARLGERRALQWFRQSLVGETHAAINDAVRRIADERLTLLWPDLDALADSDDTESSLAARESLEQLREEMAGGLPVA